MKHSQNRTVIEGRKCVIGRFSKTTNQNHMEKKMGKKSGLTKTMLSSSRLRGVKPKPSVLSVLCDAIE